MYSRREFGRLTFAALAGRSGARAFAAPVIHGVRLGVQTYSFRDLPRPADGDAVDSIIDAMKQCGLDECELYAPQIEPRIAGGGRNADPDAAQRARESARK